MAPWEIDFTMEGAYSELEINGGGTLPRISGGEFRN